MSKKILAIVQHRKGRSPGQRFRFEHFINSLEEAGYEIVFSNIISEKDDIIFYSKGKYFAKLFIVIKSFFHRLRDLKTAKNCDIVYVYREAFMLGTTYFEKRFSKMKAKLIFDFDDAIWINDTSEGNQNIKWLKKPQKTADICKYADLVTVGNKYLAEYAEKYNSNVKIIPTTIDTDYHKPQIKIETNNICIGWTGTTTTLKHFEKAIPFLKQLKNKYGDKIYFKVIVNSDSWDKDIDVKLVKWSRENEIRDLSEFDIGIMPLPNDEWSKGKCGFKGLQCMAMGIPVVMSPVGLNKEIINHGENGFLCDTDEEWFSCISSLIEDKTLWNKFSENGKKTVLNSYSVKVYKNEILEMLDKLLKS